MNSLTDQQLLGDYVEHRSEAAFAELVRRHIDFVYSAALRMVRDTHLAEDVTQAVFVAVSQNARQLVNCSVLPGWLHRTTQNLAANTVRSDVRRRSREQEAVAMNELLSANPDANWEHIAPYLDAALGELSEPDRDAVLLRYFKNHDLRAVGAALGISDDAAQKRVSRAVERLREFFAKRGVTVGASGLAVVISANAVQAAPVGLALTISTAAALTGTTLATTATITATKAIAMTALQKTIVTATIVVLAGAGVYEARQASQLHEQVQALHQQQAPLAEQVQQLNQALAEATKLAATLRDDNERLNRNTSELLKLRSEVGRLRADSQELALRKSGNMEDPTTAEAVSWKERVKLLKQHLEQNPDLKIPELQFATEQDWLNAARGKLETESDFRRAASNLRNSMENKFAGMLQPALQKFMSENNNQFPTDLTQLSPYFNPPIDAAILERYSILPKEEVPGLGMGGDWIISQKMPVDQKLDSRLGLGPNGWGSVGPQSWDDPVVKAAKLFSQVMKAYSTANGGQQPANLTELAPYIKTPEQQAAYDRVLKNTLSAQQADKQTH